MEWHMYRRLEIPPGREHRAVVNDHGRGRVNCIEVIPGLLELFRGPSGLFRSNVLEPRLLWIAAGCMLTPSIQLVEREFSCRAMR